MQTINTVLFDDQGWTNLLPLTYTRPVADIRIGITTIREKWALYAEKLSVKTQDYLSDKYPCILKDDNIFINASLIPNPELNKAISALNLNDILLKDSKILAFRSKDYQPQVIQEQGRRQDFEGEIISIDYPWHVFEKNAQVLRQDFESLTKDRVSRHISKTNNIIGAENIFVEDGAKIEFATINASNGPVYIGVNAEVMEGAVIRGPLALCENSCIKMGAKIYPDTTIGPWCKVGGEVQNVVLMAYSNKGHDGYLGNAVIGEWCNIGADTNSSNLKNNYAKIKVWNYTEERFIDTGLQFCGLIMADHSKCGINTMFNTGTVVGVSANIFGAGFPRNIIPSFTWGGASGFKEYAIKKALETAQIVMERRKIKLEDVDREILNEIFRRSASYRK